MSAGALGGVELAPRPYRLDVHPRGRGPGLAEDARAGLAATPKVHPPKYLYDERGSELFERIIYPGLEVHGVAGDFGRDLPGVPDKEGAPRLVAFLGGTIGNLEPAERAPFLASVAELADEDDLMLVGTDLAGDPARIRVAYDDSEGVTAQFNLNVLRVLNRQLDADFDLDAFAHVALYDPGPPWIEMRLRARERQVVRVAALGMEVVFEAGEELRTEISCKFTREAVEGMYADAGLRLQEWHEDPRGWFAASLARRA